MKSKLQNILNIDWLVAAVKRAIRTVAQTALGMITVGAAMEATQWNYVISVSVVAGIYSMLTSIATGLPETATDGTLQIDTTDPGKDIYRLCIDKDFDQLRTQKQVILKVDPNVKL